jgi:hypothetical protein
LAIKSSETAKNRRPPLYRLYSIDFPRRREKTTAFHPDEVRSSGAKDSGAPPPRLHLARSYQLPSRFCNLAALGNFAGYRYAPGQILPLWKGSFWWTKRNSFWKNGTRGRAASIPHAVFARAAIDG